MTSVATLVPADAEARESRSGAMVATDVTLVKLLRARVLVREARDIQAAKQFHDLARDGGTLARQQKAGREIGDEAQALSYEAARRIGQLLSDPDFLRQGPGRPEKGSGTEPLPTLADLGIDKKLSWRARLLARLPDDLFAEVRDGRTTLDRVRAARPDLFPPRPDKREYWRGMPSYAHQDLRPWKTVNVHLRNADDLASLERALGQRLTEQTRFVWHPRAEPVRVNRLWTGPKTPPRYPVYVISKGRCESRLTAKALDWMEVPYHIVVEPQEYDDYAKVIDPEKIFKLPFSNLGLGGIPARNWVWEHSIQHGAARHWILDDNIDGFCRFHHNAKIEVDNAAPFRVVEDFVDRYENVAMAGFHYDYFAPRKRGGQIPPLVWNTRVYSAILLSNKIPHRWRGRYNEDTDLSLRLLKDDYCTALFNAFLAYKKLTLTMKGGNTDELYKSDGRLKMAESLREQHPDCVRVVEKWGRWQHEVDYRAFRDNQPVLRPGLVLRDEPNDYGLTLVDLSEPMERTA